MGPTKIYAITVAILFGVLFIVSLIRLLLKIFRRIPIFLESTTSKFLQYRLVPSNRFVGPWTVLNITISLCFIAINVFCSVYRASSEVEVAERLGTLFIINAAPLYFGLHLAHIADLLGTSLNDFRTIHRSSGVMSFSILLVRMGIELYRDRVFLNTLHRNLYLFIGLCSMTLMMLLLVPFLRKLSYEFFLRTHQVLSFTIAFTIWRTLKKESLLNSICLYACLGTFSSTTLLHVVIIAYRNRLCSGGHSRAVLTTRGGQAKIVRIELKVERRIDIRPGQYLNLWLPSISFWSPFQTHPFTVLSCRPGRESILEMLIVPRRGLTWKLLREAQTDQGIAKPRTIIFSGPHGPSLPLDRYRTVVLVASGIGIFAQLPYLTQDLRHMRVHGSLKPRIYLAWQVQENGMYTEVLKRPDLLIVLELLSVALKYINDALWEDTKSKTFLLHITIHNLSETRTILCDSFDHNRISTTTEPMKVKALISSIMDEHDASQASHIAPCEDKMLVAVSSSQGIRDDLHEEVRGNAKRIKLSQLDFQPN